MILKAFLLIFVIWFCVNRWRLRKLIKLGNKLKSDMVCLPFIGHAYYFMGNNETHMKTLHRVGKEAIERDGITSFWLGDNLFLVLADPELVDILYKVYMEKGKMMKFIRFLTGNGSIFAPVPIWRPRRKILIPTFSPRNLANFVDIFARQSTTMVKKLKNVAEKGKFSLWPFMTTYTMDSVCESTLGVTVKAQENPDHPFLVAFDLLSRLMAERIVHPWVHSDIAYRLTPAYGKLAQSAETLKGFVNEIIRSKKESMKQETNKELLLDEHNEEGTDGNLKTFLELLIDQSSKHQSYTSLELMEEILVLVMAGTDTSAVGSCFTALMLASHPQVQDKVYEELKEVFGDSTRPVRAEDLPHLKYLDAVIRESLRLYPPVPVTLRRTDREFTLPNGLKIEKGCELLLNVCAVHRNPRYWGADADDFRPERFLDTPLKHPAQFLPFSYGPRNCVGYQYAMMSMKTALATLLRTYRILPDSCDTGTTLSEAYTSSEEAALNRKSEVNDSEISTFSDTSNGSSQRNRLNVHTVDKSNHTVDRNKRENDKTNINSENDKKVVINGTHAAIVQDNREKLKNDSKNNLKGNVATSTVLPKKKPLRVTFNIMMKEVNNFTIQLESRNKILN